MRNAGEANAMGDKRLVKATLPPHTGQVRNCVDFETAFRIALANPNKEFATTGNDTPFTIVASYASRGNHMNEPVLKFISDGQERARSYQCCWGHKTNCNRTHIDCYTQAVCL